MLLPSRHTPAKMALGGLGGVQSDRQEQTDTWPCDFSVILESILSNFAICPGGSDGSAELICRLLALLGLYRTSSWSGMQARCCSPVEPRGAAVHGDASRRFHHALPSLPHPQACRKNKKNPARQAALRHFHVPPSFLKKTQLGVKFLCLTVLTIRPF